MKIKAIGVFAKNFQLLVYCQHLNMALHTIVPGHHHELAQLWAELGLSD